jgi:ketosteroid isomerase-like protein
MSKAFDAYIAKWAVITLTIILLAIYCSPTQGVAQETAGSALEQKLAEVARQIAGREGQPAEEVFKNIRRLQGIEAARLLRAMNSWSRALGVSCAHCHVVDQWEKDERAAKQTAREMVGLTRTISNDLLKNISGLKSQTPAVTCTTCHRGQLKPETQLPNTKTAESQGSAIGQDEQAVMQIEAARTLAIKQGNMKALEEIYADDFTGVASGGRAVTKAQLMQVFKNVDPRVTFTTDDLKVRVLNETAVATGRITGKTSGGEVVSAFTYLHVYAKRNGRWQMVTGQSTNIPQQ